MATIRGLGRRLGALKDRVRGAAGRTLDYNVGALPGAAVRGGAAAGRAARRGVKSGLKRWEDLSPSARKRLAAVGIGAPLAATGYALARPYGEGIAEKYQDVAWPDKVPVPDGEEGELMPGPQPGELGPVEAKVPFSQRAAASARETIPGGVGEALGGAVEFAGKHPFITGAAVGVPALALYYLLRKKDDNERR